MRGFNKKLNAILSIEDTELKRLKLTNLGFKCFPNSQQQNQVLALLKDLYRT